MILVLEDRYESSLSIDTKKVPVALHLTSQWRFNDVRVTKNWILRILYENTVKPLNFARDLISLILQVMKIREIKYPRKFKFYIDSNSKASRFAKLSTCKDGSNLQFAKLSPREI